MAVSIRTGLTAALAAVVVCEGVADEGKRAVTVPMTVPADSTSTLAPSTGAAPAQEPFTMRIGARIQTRFTHASPEGGPTTNTFHIRRARLSLSGAAYELFDYALQVDLGGGSAQLLDANLRHTFAPFATLWVGQGKAYFGRQQLTSSGSLQFVDRTIVDARFAAPRQQGIALTGRLLENRVEYNAGAYNGNGINQSVNPNNRFMTVGRVVLAVLDPHPLTEAALDRPERPRLSVGLCGLRNTLGEGPEAIGIRRGNAEAAFMLGGVSAVAELYREWAEPVGAGHQITDGWYLQGGYLLPDGRNELAARYAAIRPDLVSSAGQNEAGIAYTRFLRGHSAKVQADLRNIRDRAAGTDRREARVQLQLAV